MCEFQPAPSVPRSLAALALAALAAALVALGPSSPGAFARLLAPAPAAAPAAVRLAVCVTGRLSSSDWLASFGAAEGFDFAAAGVLRILVADADDPQLEAQRPALEAQGFDIIALPSLARSAPQHLPDSFVHDRDPDFCCGERPTSTNVQRWAAYAGVLRARQLGATHFMRVRTDLRVRSFAALAAALGVPDNATFLHLVGGVPPAFRSDFLVASTMADAAAMWCGLARTPWRLENRCRRAETFLQERLVFSRRWRRLDWCRWTRALAPHDIPPGLVEWKGHDAVSSNLFRTELPPAACPEQCDDYWCEAWPTGRREELDELTADFADFYPPALVPADYEPCTEWQRRRRRQRRRADEVVEPLPWTMSDESEQFGGLGMCERYAHGGFE